MDSKNAPKRVKSGGTQISRRTVTRGVAWSAPIAAIGVAAPAFAASQPVIVRNCGTTCKHPGNSGPDSVFKIYHFTFCFFASQAINNGTVTIVSMTINGVTKPVTPDSVAVVTGQTKCYYIDALEFADSANGTASLNFSYSTAAAPAVVKTGTVNVVLNGIDRCGTSDHGTNPKDWPHDPQGNTPSPDEPDGPPPTNLNCT